MKRLIGLVSLLAVFVFSASTVSAQACPGANRELVAYASEKLTITDSTAAGFTASVYAPAGTTVAYANFSVATNGLNVTMDGTTPTSTVGVALAAAAVYFLPCFAIGSSVVQAGLVV